MTDGAFCECAETDPLRFYYENGQANFLLRLYYSDEVWNIKALTCRLYSDFFLVTGNAAVFFPSIESLSDCLSVENGVYAPDTELILKSSYPKNATCTDEMDSQLLVIQKIVR